MYEKYDTGFYSDENCKNKITKITVPSRVNYTFNGYFEENERVGKTITDASGNIKCGTNFFPNKININDGNHYDDTTSTVYAYWIPATYKITLDDATKVNGIKRILHLIFLIVLLLRAEISVSGAVLKEMIRQNLPIHLQLLQTHMDHTSCLINQEKFI